MESFQKSEKYFKKDRFHEFENLEMESFQNLKNFSRKVSRLWESYPRKVFIQVGKILKGKESLKFDDLLMESFQKFENISKGKFS